MTVNTQTNSALSEAALPELEKVDNVIITVDGKQYLEAMKAQAEISILLERIEQLKADRETMLSTVDQFKAQNIELIKEVSRLNSSAIKQSVTFNELKNHLFKMLDEHEATWDTSGEESPFSYEFAGDYIPAAKQAKVLGRKSDRIKEVEEWMNSSDSLPWKVK